MKTGDKKLFIIELVLICLLLLNFFVINITNAYIFSIFLLIPIVLVILLLGFEKNRQRFRKDIILNIVIFTLLFQLFLYIFGLFTGFLRSAYSFSFLGIIRNVSSMLLIILSSEVLRYSINTKGQKNLLILILSAVIFVLIDINMQISFKFLNSTQAIIELINLIMLPSITKNVLLTYFSYKFGYQSTIIYRIIMEIPTYLIPIYPNLNNYLNTIFYFFFPFVFALITYRKLKKYYYEDEKSVREKKNMIGIAVLCSVLGLIIFFTSGIGPVYTLAIGSGSMKNTINIGDMVVVKKVKQRDINKLRENDVLVYRYDNKVIAHRIVEIREVDEKYLFKTKGDNNAEKDSWTVDQQDVIGLVKLKIPYIGYPTVWLNGIK